VAAKIIILADDLSGAAELAGIAFAHGLSAEVQRQFDPTSTAQVVAIDTDSRDLPESGAAQLLRSVAQQIIGAGTDCIFKKVDSLLRGNVRTEIEAVLDVTGHRRALLIPANPSRGRVIANGRYLIDGMPLNRTSFALDPNHPRRSADIRELLGDAGELQVQLIGKDESLPTDGIIVPDVATVLDIERSIHDTAGETLLAGAADCFAALLALRLRRRPAIGPPVLIVPPALLVCGSRASWAARRADCDAAGIPVIAPGEHRALGSCGALGLGERELPDTSLLLHSFLPRLIESFFTNSTVKTLLIEGGATAASVAAYFGWTRFAVTARAPAGVGVLRPFASGTPLVIIKPGSYPWPTEIWQAFLGCRDG
jgi:D-threonate/D-erythronate kinase